MYALRNRNTGKQVGRNYRSLDAAVEDVAKMQLAIKKFAGEGYYLPIEVLDKSKSVIVPGHPEFFNLMENWIEKSAT